MRRLALAGLIVAVALALLPERATAWPGTSPFAGPARAAVWSGATRYGSPFPGPPLGELQNEAWGRYLRRQYLRNNPRPSPQVHPRAPVWAWVAPAWQWDGFRWVWIPGYWIPGR